jgi:hypothetical protein
MIGIRAISPQELTLQVEKLTLQVIGRGNLATEVIEPTNRTIRAADWRPLLLRRNLGAGLGHQQG